MPSLKELALDPASNYMSGKVTSTFAQTTSDVISSSSVQDATNLVMSGASAATNTINIVVNAEDTISNIMNTAMTTLSKAAMEEVGKAVKEIMNFSTVPTDITTYSLEYFNSHKKDFGTALKEIYQLPTDIASKQDEENKESGIKNMMSNATNVANKLNDTITKEIGYANDKLNYIMSYVQEGPDWLSRKVNEWCNDTIDEISYKVDNKTKHMKEQRQKFIWKVGGEIGETLVDNYNTIIDNSVKSIKDEKDKAVSKAKIEATKALQSAALKLMAKLGVYVDV